MRVRAPPLLDLVVPVRCAACSKGELLLCAGCRASLRRLVPPLCARCGAPTLWPVARCRECAGRRLAFRSARAAVAYEGAARTLIAAWKERGLRKLDDVVAELVTETMHRPDVDAITFIPGDGDRTLWRGRNTADVLARGLGERWDLPVVKAVERTRAAPRQRGLSRVQRRGNVRRAFRAREDPPRRLLLVDDVYTTGATVGAAATELRRSGTQVVEVATLARAVRG